MIEAFRQELVTKITGLTPRRLRRLERLGIVTPSVAPREEGWPPLYSFNDLIKLRVASELLARNFNAPQVRELIDELERRGFDNPLTTVRFVGDEPEEPEGIEQVERGRPKRKYGRAFIVYPGTADARSARHVDQVAQTYDMRLKDLRADLMGTIAELTQRPTGRVEKVRGVQASAFVIAGTRVPTNLIAKLAKAGWSRDRIREAYPHLTPDDIDAALKHEGIPEDAVA